MTNREIDALVAEKVFGRPRFAKKVLPMLGAHAWGDVGYGDQCIVCGLNDRSKGPNVCLPFYSSDISAAWEVVEKLNRYHFEIARVIKDMKSVEYRVKIPGVYPNELIEVHSYTAPIAICLAALKSVGVSIDGIS